MLLRALPGGLGLARLKALAVVPLLAGCMTVHLETGSGQVKVTRHIGALSIELAAPPEALVGTVRGLGLVSSPLGASAGWTHQRFAVLGPLCRAVVFLDGAGTLDEGLRRSIENAAGVCLVDARDGARPPQEVPR